MRVLQWAVAVAVLAASCGGPANQASGQLGPTGGEVCLADQRVCIIVPPAALEATVTIRIAPTADVPAGALGEGFEIGPSGTEFLKSATVIFKIEALYEADSGINWSNEPSDTRGVNPLSLRLYTRYQGDWEPLAIAVVPLDRVRRTLTGTVDHLSPFVILRTDRLSDGGLPIETDGGKKDAGGPIVIPYFDAGRPDAGRPDSGTADAGRVDSGTPDAGRADAGTPDAGRADSGTPDSGTPDAGRPDAGPVDAGPVDAGPLDAGPVDAGPVDAGPVDAGPVDAGPIDAGPVDAGDPDAGADAGDGG